ncbi:hypothetical protein ABW19_dt0204524 [Dactylella cylindrospora]|nr:hypothetical protein ABW19_dt0204524 [Dactylella cylindrospora]
MKPLLSIPFSCFMLLLYSWHVCTSVIQELAFNRIIGDSSGRSPASGSQGDRASSPHDGLHQKLHRRANEEIDRLVKRAIADGEERRAYEIAHETDTVDRPNAVKYNFGLLEGSDYTGKPPTGPFDKFLEAINLNNIITPGGQYLTSIWQSYDKPGYTFQVEHSHKDQVVVFRRLQSNPPANAVYISRLDQLFAPIWVSPRPPPLPPKHFIIELDVHLNRKTADVLARVQTQDLYSDSSTGIFSFSRPPPGDFKNSEEWSTLLGVWDIGAVQMWLSKNPVGTKGCQISKIIFQSPKEGSKAEGRQKIYIYIELAVPEARNTREAPTEFPTPDVPPLKEPKLVLKPTPGLDGSEGVSLHPGLQYLFGSSYNPDIWDPEGKFVYDINIFKYWEATYDRMHIYRFAGSDFEGGDGHWVFISGPFDVEDHELSRIIFSSFYLVGFEPYLNWFNFLQLDKATTAIVGNLFNERLKTNPELRVLTIVADDKAENEDWRKLRATKEIRVIEKLLKNHRNTIGELLIYSVEIVRADEEGEGKGKFAMLIQFFGHRNEDFDGIPDPHHEDVGQTIPGDAGQARIEDETRPGQRNPAPVPDNAWPFTIALMAGITRRSKVYFDILPELGEEFRHPVKPLAELQRKFLIKEPKLWNGGIETKNLALAAAQYLKLPEFHALEGWNVDRFVAVEMHSLEPTVKFAPYTIAGSEAARNLILVGPGGEKGVFRGDRPQLDEQTAFVDGLYASYRIIFPSHRGNVDVERMHTRHLKYVTIIHPSPSTVLVLQTVFQALGLPLETDLGLEETAAMIGTSRGRFSEHNAAQKVEYRRCWLAILGTWEASAVQDMLWDYRRYIQQRRVSTIFIRWTKVTESTHQPQIFLEFQAEGPLFPLPLPTRPANPQDAMAIQQSLYTGYQADLELLLQYGRPRRDLPVTRKFDLYIEGKGKILPRTLLQARGQEIKVTAESKSIPNQHYHFSIYPNEMIKDIGIKNTDVQRGAAVSHRTLLERAELLTDFPQLLLYIANELFEPPQRDYVNTRTESLTITSVSVTTLYLINFIFSFKGLRPMADTLALTRLEGYTRVWSLTKGDRVPWLLLMGTVEMHSVARLLLDKPSPDPQPAISSVSIKFRGPLDPEILVMFQRLRPGAAIRWL